MTGTGPGALPVCRVGDNTLDTGPVPIIFVPGVMGSRLYFESLDIYWDPDHKLRRMPSWLLRTAERRRRAFDLANEAEIMSEGDELSDDEARRGWAGVAAEFYVPLLRHLEAQRFGAYTTPVYAIGYDWRQDNRDSGDEVADQIATILDEEDADRYILVSHSMGGLVTRAALKRNGEVAGKLAGVIHIAQPATGAAVLVRRMFSGATRALDGTAMWLLLGGNRKKFQTIISALPGAMQLLCSQHYRDTNGEWWYDYETFEEPGRTRAWEGNIWELYGHRASPPGLLAPLDSPHAIDSVPHREFRQRLVDAREYHEEIDEPGVGPWKHERTWSIYGTGHTCDTAVHFKLPPVEAEMKVIPSMGMAPPMIFYEATRADGSTVMLQADDADPLDRGVDPQRSQHSDSTVPASSGASLFPGQRHPVEEGADYEARRQFEVEVSAEHDTICTDATVLRGVVDLIHHLVGS